MKIQPNTDVHIDGTEALAGKVSATVETPLKSYGEHITRVEVHPGDGNGDKGGPQDQCCTLEARLEGRPPEAVTDLAATMEQAVHDASQKLARLLESTLGRLHDHREKAARPPLPGTEPEAR